MTIKTYSAFTYGHTINSTNNTIPFSEDDVLELLGTLRSGSYTLEDFAIEIVRAMNSVGTLNYVATVDRLTRKITITGDAVFYLYVTSSASSSISPYALSGFTTERSGADNYEGDSASGSFFEPQLHLQSFVDFQDFQTSNNVTVATTGTGKVQVAKHGDNNFMECNITLQTNIPQGYGSDIKNLPGEDDLRLFMQYAAQKKPLEFIPDIDGVSFTDCILESTPTDKNGTGFKLKELYAKGFTDWFESGRIKFRELK